MTSGIHAQIRLFTRLKLMKYFAVFEFTWICSLWYIRCKCVSIRFSCYLDLVYQINTSLLKATITNISSLPLRQVVRRKVPKSIVAASLTIVHNLTRTYNYVVIFDRSNHKNLWPHCPHTHLDNRR